MKILIVGGSGMLGHKLVQVWKDKFDVWTTIRAGFSDFEKFKIFDREKIFEKINVEDIGLIEGVIKQIKPDVVINAVGIIKQIASAKDVIKTLTVNSIFPNRLADLAVQYKYRLLTLSTDCVFNGEKGNYKESDNPDALDLYGKSKQLGEVTTENCLTLRTSIIGRELITSHSLVEWFLSNRGKSVKGFVNAVFSGFPTIILADILSDLIENHTQLKGLYHVSSEPINKFDLLKLIKKNYKADIEIEPFEDFMIDRSLDSTRFREATGFESLGWEEMIKRMASDNAVYRK